MNLSSLFVASLGLGFGMHLAQYAASQVDGFMRGVIIAWMNARAGRHQKWEVMCPTCVQPMHRHVCDCCLAVVPPFMPKPPEPSK